MLMPAGCSSLGKEETAGAGGKNSSGTETGEGPIESVGQHITLTGKITVKGSEPRTFTALTAEDGAVYEISGPLAGQLAREYQYVTVTLEGELVRQSAGPGMPARFRAEKIVSTEQ